METHIVMVNKFNNLQSLQKNVNLLTSNIPKQNYTYFITSMKSNKYMAMIFP